MRVLAALDPALQHARHRHVGAEIGPAGDLVAPIGADRAGADEAQRGFIEITHALTPPQLRAAAIIGPPASGRYAGETPAVQSTLPHPPSPVGRVERSITRQRFAG